MKFLHFFLLIICPLFSFGQINLQHNGLRSGDEIIKQQVEYKDPGRSGENVIWDFGRLKSVNDQYSLVYTSPILQEKSFYVMGYDTIQSKNISENSLIIGTEHNTMYYYQLKGNQLLLLGHENSTNLLHYTEPVVATTYPTNYKQINTGNYQSEGIYSGRIPFDTKGIITTQADAYGAIILPTGDTLSNVLRIKTIQTISEIIRSINPAMNDSLEMVVETYKWYSKGYRYPIFETILATNTTDTTNIQKYQTAFFFPPQEHLYLDDDKENLAVLDSLWNIEHNKEIDNPITNPETNPKLSYNFYPNPVESQLTVEYYQENPAAVTMTIYSMEGKLVKNQLIGKQDRGLHSEYIDCTNLSKGTYILRIQTNEKITSDKFIKK
ncbi:putative secreted protein (Por secretion system target) [Dysgonomonas alginatilytica]|uniref:Putative secreted protein (Por secretion system target) n=1 Tax=Dysgonomonas alginatilytica TaxID=1605892 RepID=A0A2V3PK80_9BACT|nr:T9SS type A sorting domain-containing protein [Dysgonomonas alginatilytica]PXV59337.1 putative secreted protein (Por secretion system target) [Dysgonomonas alginatilytica]